MTDIEEDRLVDGLCAGDAAAFTQIVTLLHPNMVRLAASFVPSRAVAEEVAQETWMAVIKGLPRFERRSSLKTWIMRILVNIATTRVILANGAEGANAAGYIIGGFSRLVMSGDFVITPTGIRKLRQTIKHFLVSS